MMRSDCSGGKTTRKGYRKLREKISKEFQLINSIVVLGFRRKTQKNISDSFQQNLYSTSEVEQFKTKEKESIFHMYCMTT